MIFCIFVARYKKLTMKKLILIVFLLNNIICYSQITVIYGNVAAPDVNIQETTTLVGTSSVNDGIYYLANLNIQNATFENPVKASNKIYPNILKINNNKIYTSYFNAEKQLGFIDIMEL